MKKESCCSGGTCSKSESISLLEKLEENTVATPNKKERQSLLNSENGVESPSLRDLVRQRREASLQKHYTHTPTKKSIPFDHHHKKENVACCSSKNKICSSQEGNDDKNSCSSGHSHDHSHSHKEHTEEKKDSCCSSKKCSSGKSTHSHSYEDEKMIFASSEHCSSMSHDVMNHESPNCIAILRDDGKVDVYDIDGVLKIFSSASIIKSDAANSKFCFSSHGHDVDSFLTPCFDENGRHGEPEESCFCGIDVPHLHAHRYHNKTCTDDVDGKSMPEMERLAGVVFFPVDEEEQLLSATNSIPLSEGFPSNCNSKEYREKLELSKSGTNYSKSQKKVFKIRHDDHMDTLVHNERTGHITLEHDCEDCGDRDVHGKLSLVSKRTLRSSSLNVQGASDSERQITLNFYEIPRSPLKILDLLSEFFQLEEDRASIIRHAFPCAHHVPLKNTSGHCDVPSCCVPSPKRRSQSHVVQSSCCEHVNEDENIVPPVAEKGEVRSTIHVKAICCAAEIPMIKSILDPIQGIESVAVVTTTKLVHVTHSLKKISAEEITEALNAQKFGATLKKDGAQKKVSVQGSGKSTFFVAGICCSAEIPAINSILEPLKGVEKVTINVPNKTVYVVHEFQYISASEIKEVLDSKKFDCTIKKDAGADIKLRGMKSEYVESTIFVASILEARDGDRVKQTLYSNYSRDEIFHVDVHVPSKTIKFDHNPKLLSVNKLVEFLNDTGVVATVITDGFEEGIWSAGVDNDIEEHEAKLEWNVMLSGVFWIVSMLHFIDDEGNWGYLKYTALISVALGIPKIAQKALLTMRRKQFDTNCMMLFATIGALALQEFSEAAAVTFLFSISDWLETLSTSRARNALSAIVRLRPERAQVQDSQSGKFKFVPASDVPIGSIVSVRTGDKIPCDGVVVEGSTVVDESSLTGESRPVQKVPGDEVSGGTINAGLAKLLVKTTSTADDSAVSRLIRLVEEAQANRSETEKLIDEFAKRYTPLVVLLSISMCTFPWIVSYKVGKEWTKIGLVTIVIACPCALIISTPVTYVAGLAAAAQRGIVVKGGAHLEALGRVKRIAFDKTGTLTEGNFKLLHLRAWNMLSREESLRYIYAMEEHASHPLAAAMISAAKAENVDIPKEWKVDNHQNLEGEGVKAQINGKEVHVGNLRLFNRLNLTEHVPADEMSTVQDWLHDGSTVGFMSVEGFGIVCSYCVADSVRSEAKSVIHGFTDLGIDVNMLTGDNAKAATSIGLGVGLKHNQIKSNLLPHEKLDLVEEMMKNEKSLVSERRCFKGVRPGLILMVGDGVNDAPALALADVGVAMGAGAALAMETADITLLDSNLEKLLKVVKLGKAVTRTIIENVTFSLVAKAVVMGFTFAGYSSLWAAIGSDVGAMLIVTANGMKLLPSKKSVKAGSGFDSNAVKNGDEESMFPVRLAQEKS